MVITIARECGCEGDEVGRKLSEQYGIPCYSKKELVELAKEKNIYEKYPFYFGERPIDDMMSSIAGDVQDKVRETPHKALAALVGEQSCIVVGRASDYAYKDNPDAVRIFLCGDKKKRIAKIAKKHKVTELKAKMIVDDTDRRRKQYHNYYSGETWGLADNYDLCLDECRLGIDGVAAVVSAYLKCCGMEW